VRPWILAIVSPKNVRFELGDFDLVYARDICKYFETI
jgi:hypothetical protein